MSTIGLVLALVGGLIGLLFNALLVTFLIEPTYGWLSALCFLLAVVASAAGFRSPRSAAPYVVVFGLAGALLSPAFTAAGLAAGVLTFAGGFLARFGVKPGEPARGERAGLGSLLQAWWQAGQKVRRDEEDG